MLFCSQLLDYSHKEHRADAERAEQLLSLLTPVAKACMTEWGFEACDLGIQVFGGHGYITESGIEQRLRDVRITRIYEGTNGIQALDFLGRKVLADEFRSLQLYIDEIGSFCSQYIGDEYVGQWVEVMLGQLKQWESINNSLKSADSKFAMEALAFDYLMYTAYTILAYQWLRIACSELQIESESNRDWVRQKLLVTRFCYRRILPRSEYHSAVLLSGVGTEDCIYTNR